MKLLKPSVSVLSTAIVALAASVAFGQVPSGLKYVSTSAKAEPATIPAGGKSTIDVKLSVISGFHINAAKPKDPDLIPTAVSEVVTPGFKFGAVIYPKAVVINAPSLSQQPLLVYLGSNIVKIPITASKSVKPGLYKLSVSVQYQGCNTSACFPPKTDNISVPVVVTP